MVACVEVKRGEVRRREVGWGRGRGEGRGEGVCVVGRGFYEVRCALLNSLDFVMPPADRGPLSGGPLYPRAPGGAAPLVPPSSSCTAFFAGQLPSGADAYGRSARRNAMCAMLPVARMGEGTIIPRSLRRASATPKLPPRKASAAIFGCGRVSPHIGWSSLDAMNTVSGGCWPLRRWELPGAVGGVNAPMATVGGLFCSRDT